MSALALLASAYDDVEPTAEGTAAHLVTSGDDGWPHAAVLSVGEVVIRADGGCALALWAGTRTTANLCRTSRATFLTVLDEQAVRARLSVIESPTTVPGPVELTCFVGAVEEAVAESAPYARLTSGARFVLHEPDAVLPRWTATRAVLRGLLA